MSDLSRLSDIRHSIVARRAEAFYQAMPEKLTIIDGWFQARAILALIGIGIFRVLSLGGQLAFRMKYWDSVWVLDVCLMVLALEEGLRWFVHREYEIRPGEITIRTRVLRFCRVRALQYTAADVSATTSPGPENSEFKRIAIRQGSHEVLLSLRPFNGMDFDGIRFLIETYLAGKVVDA